MLQLTADNAVAYLRSQKWIGPGPARIDVLSGGVSNAVLRVETAEGAYVLKQSCPQLRTKEAWFSDLDRVYREQEVMQVLHPLLPVGVVPEVLFSDRDNYVFAMSHAPAASRNWKEMLLAGEIDTQRGEQAGIILGRMHERTAGEVHSRRQFTDRKVFVQLRVDPFYRMVQARRPEVAARIDPIIDRLLTAEEALCHGDFTPKNLLAHADGFTLVDYETAHLGDPSMDIGLFLAHIVLKAVRRPEIQSAYLTLAEAFWSAYMKAISYGCYEQIVAHGIEHLGVCLLARVDGTSPVDYLSEEQRDEVRRLALAILRERLFRWSEVVALMDQNAKPSGE